MKPYEHLAAFVVEHPWNLTRPMLSIVASILARRIAAQEPDQTDIEAAPVDSRALPHPRRGNVAIVPVYGLPAPRMNLMSEMSSGTTYQMLGAQIREAASDKAVKTLLLDVDSPGGSVAGNAELASEIMRAR